MREASSCFWTPGDFWCQWRYPCFNLEQVILRFPFEGWGRHLSIDQFMLVIELELIVGSLITQVLFLKFCQNNREIICGSAGFKLLRVTAWSTNGKKKTVNILCITRFLRRSFGGFKSTVFKYFFSICTHSAKPPFPPENLISRLRDRLEQCQKSFTKVDNAAEEIRCPRWSPPGIPSRPYVQICFDQGKPTSWRIVSSLRELLPWRGPALYFPMRAWLAAVRSPRPLTATAWRTMLWFWQQSWRAIYEVLVFSCWKMCQHLFYNHTCISKKSRYGKVIHSRSQRFQCHFHPYIFPCWFFFKPAYFLWFHVCPGW